MKVLPDGTLIIHSGTSSNAYDVRIDVALVKAILADESKSDICLTEPSTHHNAIEVYFPYGWESSVANLNKPLGLIVDDSRQIEPLKAAVLALVSENIRQRRLLRAVVTTSIPYVLRHGAFMIPSVLFGIIAEYLNPQIRRMCELFQKREDGREITKEDIDAMLELTDDEMKGF